MSNDTVTIGIDLGTTYSCVAVFQHGKVEVIPNGQGNRTTPSVVAFTTEGVLVGDSGKNSLVRNPTRTVYDAKRLIGRRFKDPEVQSDIKHWPFTVCADESGYAAVQVDDKSYMPEQISAHILKYLKGCAETYLGREVSRAVVTVPAYFNDAQRERTKAAGKIAGLDVLRIINEPTAAALAYGLHKDSTKGSNVLVFDLGGGTFDVSIIRLEGGVFEVKATAGDTHLGGEDFDNTLVEHWLGEIKKSTGVDLRSSSKSMGELKSIAETAKKQLSFEPLFHMDVDGLANGEDVSLRMSRAKFEDLNDKLFKKCIVEVKKVLQLAELNKADVDEIVMVGGSTRILKVQAMVSEFFSGKALCHTVNPDEAVACGAAIQASILSEHPSQKCDVDVLLIDVASLSIGVNVDDGRYDVLIPRSSTIPCSVTKEYTTIDNGQTEVLIEIYEGERPRVADNHLIGTFKLHGIKKAKRGKVSIAVTFSLDANGVLTVTAEEKGGKKGSVTVQNNDRLSTQDVERMIQVARDQEEEDKRVREALELCVDMEQRLYKLKSRAKKCRGDAAERILSGVVKALAWLSEKRSGDLSLEDLRRNEEKVQKMETTLERCEAEVVDDGAAADRSAKKAKKSDSSEDSPQREGAGTHVDDSGEHEAVLD